MAPNNDLDSGPEGRLVRADALDLARSLPEGSLDLVYLDPPFGTGSRRSILQGRGGRNPDRGRAAYGDPRTDTPPESQVLLWQQVWRVLRPGGAFFLHLDWRTVHRAKLLLDDVFGADNFLNEIIWHYATGGIPTRWFARKHDTILYYVKSGEGGDGGGGRDGGDGRHGGGGRDGEGGRDRGGEEDRCSGHTFHRLKEKKYLAHRMGRKGVEEFRDEGGWYRFRYMDDVWNVPWLTQDAKERTGYPTQKPVALLGRMIEATTDPGDRVADFCCGSGTTAVAALRSGRRWIAGDSSPLAFEVARARIEVEQREHAPETEVRYEIWDETRTEARDENVGG